MQRKMMRLSFSMLLMKSSSLKMMCLIPSMKSKVQKKWLLNSEAFQKLQDSPVHVALTLLFLRKSRLKTLKVLSNLSTHYGTEDKPLSSMVFHILFKRLQKRFTLKKVKRRLWKTLNIT